jgi:hypothetical protein
MHYSLESIHGLDVGKNNDKTKTELIHELGETFYIFLKRYDYFCIRDLTLCVVVSDIILEITDFKVFKDQIEAKHSIIFSQSFYRFCPVTGFKKTLLK